jgi:thymidylate synthase
MEVIGFSATETWLTALEHVLTAGKLTQSRGTNTYELLNFHTVMYMHKPIVTVPARKLGYRFMFAEAAWILSGEDRVSTIAPYSKMISNFSDNGETFFGAYGTKILPQLEHVINTLGNDPWSRQAVINIWRESPPVSKDIPCTVSAQFLIRDGLLHCIDTMRSSDVWLGWPYDAFNFSMLSSYIILALKNRVGLNLKLGLLHMNLGSFHIYSNNTVAAQVCLLPEEYTQRKFRYPILNPIEEWNSPEELVKHLWAVAEQRPQDLNSQWVHCVAEGKHNK